MSKIKIIVSFYLLFISLSCLGQFRPRPTHPAPFLHDSTKTIKPLIPIVPNSILIKEVLDNYGNGAYIHPDMNRFCNNVMARVNLARNGRIKYEIHNITITGFADGTPNRGIPYVPTPYRSCFAAFGLKIYDSELSELRGCIINENFKTMFGTGYSVVPPVLTFYDEPDYTNVGGSHRKVEIEIVMLKK